MTLRSAFILLSLAGVCLIVIGAALISVTEETDDWPTTRERPYMAPGGVFLMSGVLLLVAVPSIYYYSVLAKASRYLDMKAAAIAGGASESSIDRTALSEGKDEGVDLRAPRFCRHCGREIPSDSAFCEYCGKPLRERAIGADGHTRPGRGNAH